jgi:hypothetical protein
MQLTKGPHPIFWPLLGGSIEQVRSIGNAKSLWMDFLWYMKIKNLILVENPSGAV